MALTYNNFKSTTIKGSFNNLDYPDGSIIASANFQRNVDIKGNLNLGNETSTTNATTNITTYTDTGGNILFKINGITYTITPTILSYLSTLNSNVQTQITNLTGTVGQLNDTNSQVMKFYNAINTGWNYGTIISIGNFTVPDYTGSSINIKLNFHAGYNGLNSQDYVTDIFFKVSNRDSGDTANFPANSWYGIIVMVEMSSIRIHSG